MNTINYEISSNVVSNKKTTDKTNFYIGLDKICPKCEKVIVGYLALSRRDNKTEICSRCGTLEALEDFMKYDEEIKNEHQLYQLVFEIKK